MAILRMSDLDLHGKRVLIREDLNVPIKDGKISSEQRIKATLPTLRLALAKGAAVMVTSISADRKKACGVKPIHWRRWQRA